MIPPVPETGAGATAGGGVLTGESTGAEGLLLVAVLGAGALGAGVIEPPPPPPPALKTTLVVNVESEEVALVEPDIEFTAKWYAVPAAKPEKVTL